MEGIINAIIAAEDNPLQFNVILNVVEYLAQPIEQDVERAVRVRNQNYFEGVIPQYTDVTFKQHFRMSRDTVEYLCNIIGHHMPNPNATVPLQKKILCTLWILSNQISYRDVGDRFGLSKGTAHYCVTQIVNTLAELLPEYVRWPNEERQQLSATIFQARSNGFPGVVGAIDGCHIPCRQPPHNANDYYNRHGQNSIILQGTCDHHLRFIDVFIGLPGRIHDARVFRNSPLGQALNGGIIARNNMHLIGDSAYPLNQHLMTPFRDNGHLNVRETTYNIKLSSIRSVIERAFGLLKGKFRRLKDLQIEDFDLGNRMIAACCVLHNIVIDNRDVDLIDSDEEADENGEDDDDNDDLPEDRRHAINHGVV